jgi:hypothetical protein
VKLNIFRADVTSPSYLRVIGLLIAIVLLPAIGGAQKNDSQAKLEWKEVPFAIVKLNDQPPISWNMYHSQNKKEHGTILLRLWKRFLLIRMKDEEAYDLDPKKVQVIGDTAIWSRADIPSTPVDLQEYKERNIGLNERITFRFGKNGHTLELQIPLAPNGDPMY